MPREDGIGKLAFKTVTTRALGSLALIINGALELDHFPTSWKEVDVIMVLNSLISLLSNLSKVFEKVMLTRLREETAKTRIVRLGWTNNSGLAPAPMENINCLE